MRKAVLLLSLASTALPADIPGWALRGEAPRDFEASLDRDTRHGGNASAVIWALAKHPRGFGGLLQFFRPDEYAGRRIRLSAWVKGLDVRLATIWMRVDGPSGEMLAFDNRRERVDNGTFDWRKQEIVLDVPRQAATIFIGFILKQGRAWVDDFSIEIVDRKVRTTGVIGPGPVNPQFTGLFVDHSALNLDFETQR
jgi:hypothetical protein